MLHTNGGDLDHGATKQHDGEERGRAKLAPPLQIPKNRSTGNLAVTSDSPEKARIRFSFDAGAAAAEYDALARTPIMTDHDHGLGLSGLRRIRQHPPRTPTIPSLPASRSPSLGPSRSSSVTMMLDQRSFTLPLSPGPASPVFTEDLSRFPSDSLHSFSFAHQSEELIHNRQNLLKRSLEFLRDRLGWSAGQDVSIASAQARASGDLEMQGVLDLLARAQLVGAGNISSTLSSSVPQAPLSGPPNMSGENVFDKEFIPRTASPELVDDEPLRPYVLPSVPESKQPDIPQPDAQVPTKFLSPSSPVPDTGHPLGVATAQSSPPSRRPTNLRRTLTDTVHVSMQQKLIDTMAKPFLEEEGSAPARIPNPTTTQSFPSANGPSALSSSAIHGHSTRWVPAAQAIFTTKAKPPYTILAANDLACLVFGVTKAEVRKMGIMEVVQEERRAWLERKLQHGHSADANNVSEGEILQPEPTLQPSKLLGGRAGGITSKLLSKPNSRSVTPTKAQAARRAATVHSGDVGPTKPSNHNNNRSRGVLLCGDVVPIRKRNGATGSASLWVKEKRVGLIWVLEEIHEDIASLTLDEDGLITKLSGALAPIWGDEAIQPGIDIGKLVPRIPRQGIDPRFGAIDYAQIAKKKYFTCRNSGRINIPATVEQVKGKTELRVSSFPHIAGIVVVNTSGLTIKSSNSVFCGALFGHDNPDGLSINNLIPNFDKVLRILTEEDGVNLTDGIVVPEHSFRKASAFLALREGRADAATGFLRPDGLPARHRDGSELKIDVQMRVVQSEKQTAPEEDAVANTTEGESASADQAGESFPSVTSELVYALWITYSRHLHATRNNLGAASPLLSGAGTPLHQPSPGQTTHFLELFL